MGKQSFGIDFTMATRVARKRKVKVQEAEIKQSGYIDALLSLPEELKDDKFLTAYIRTRAIKRTQRSLAKQKREEAQAVIAKIKKIEKQAESHGELLYAIRNKDFQYNYWELPNGKVFKEVIARPGLMLTK